jgi:dehydrogenase/reductase SDR family protein 4
MRRAANEKRMDLFDLSGKVAVVTGSSRGIGRASAERLAAAGARVVVSSRKADACEEVAVGIRQRGGEALVIPCNISRRDELEHLAGRTEAEWGGIDVLVLNAASNPVYGPMSALDEAAVDKILDNNLKSSLWLCNRVLPQMAPRGGGSVILMSSITGMVGTRNLGMYAISKAADMQLARNLAVEWGHADIRVNCIAPGLVRTEFAKALLDNPKSADFVKCMTPLGRPGEPDDIAGVVCFLAAPASRFITGQTLVVDGGATIYDPL